MLWKIPAATLTVTVRARVAIRVTVRVWAVVRVTCSHDLHSAGDHPLETFPHISRRGTELNIKIQTRDPQTTIGLQNHAVVVTESQRSDPAFDLLNGV